MTTLYSNPAPELFRREQIITQIHNGLELHRVVVSVGEDSVDVTTPAAPHWGISTFGRRDPITQDAEYGGNLIQILPPNVGLVHRRSFPRTNRALVRALGSILVAQRLVDGGATVGCHRRLDGPLRGAHILVPTALNPNYVFELICAYLPYEEMQVTLRFPSVPYPVSRLIVVEVKE